jgi:hypothetical protein
VVIVVDVVLGGESPREAFAKHGIVYEIAAEPKSDVYRDVLPLLNSGRVELLDHPRLLAQFAALDRHTARGGRDSVDHPPHGHDGARAASLVWTDGKPLWRHVA